MCPGRTPPWGIRVPVGFWGRHQGLAPRTVRGEVAPVTVEGGRGTPRLGRFWAERLSSLPGVSSGCRGDSGVGDGGSSVSNSKAARVLVGWVRRRSRSGRVEAGPPGFEGRDVCPRWLVGWCSQRGERSGRRGSQVFIKMRTYVPVVGGRMSRSASATGFRGCWA